MAKKEKEIKVGPAERTIQYPIKGSLDYMLLRREMPGIHIAEFELDGQPVFLAALTETQMQIFRTKMKEVLETEIPKGSEKYRIVKSRTDLLCRKPGTQVFDVQDEETGELLFKVVEIDPQLEAMRQEFRKKRPAVPRRPEQNNVK